jgi:carbonic anhydrase
VAAGFLVPQKDDGPPNAAFDPVFENLPSEVTESAVLVDGVSVDLDVLLPSDRGYFSYLGSLTMPPCTEGVQWLLLAEPMEIPSEQIADFTAIYDHNYRPTQPVNGREIQADESD